MIFYVLLKHECKFLVRTLASRRVATIFLGLLGLYCAFALATLGFLWREMSALVKPGLDPRESVTAHLLAAFLALAVLRFFFQRNPRMRMQAYLHLPVSRRHLISFFLIRSLASLHNAFPLVFFVPFWLRYGDEPISSGWTWLAAVVAMLLLSHFVNTLLRVLATRSRKGLLTVCAVLLLAVSADLVFGSGVLQTASLYVFDTLFHERPLLLLVPVLLTVIAYVASSRLLRVDLVSADAGRLRAEVGRWQVPFSGERLSNLVLMELKLMWRCGRPKLYFLTSLIFGTLYMAAPMFNEQLAQNTIVNGLVALFASGIFAVNYGPFMFSWEGAYFDGLLVRRLASGDMVTAKLRILQGSCALFFVLALPVFALAAPHLLPLHIALLLYNTGLLSVLVLLLALSNRERVDLTRSGFFDFEGFSIRHLLWSVPSIAPPIVVLWVAPQDEALLIIGAAGAVSLLLAERWASLLSARFRRRRYAMAAGFRQMAGG